MRALSVLVLCAGCYRSPAPPPAPPPELPRRVRTAADPLAFLPQDAQIVVSIDGGQLRSSVLWQRVEGPLRAKAGDTFAAFVAKCGYDPIKAVKRLSIALRRREPLEGVMVVRGLDRDTTLRCFAQNPDPRATLHDGFLSARSETGTIVLGFATASTMVVLLGADATEQALTRVFDAGAPLRDAPAFSELYGHIDSTAALWFVIDGAIFPQAATLGMHLIALLGSADLSSGLAGTLRVRFETPDQATSVVGLAQAQSATAKQVLEDFEVTAENADVIVRLGMTQSQLDAVLTMLGMVI